MPCWRWSSAPSHPWTRGNFTDAMVSGYQIQLLMGDEQILGYFVGMLGVDGCTC